MADDRNLVEITVRLRDEAKESLNALEKRINDILRSPSKAGFATTNQADEMVKRLTESYNRLKPATDAFYKTLAQGNQQTTTAVAAVKALAVAKNQLHGSTVAVTAAQQTSHNSILQYAAGYVTGRLAIDAFNASIRLIPGLMDEGLRTIDRMKLSAASMAGAMLTNQPTMDFTEGLGRANAIIEKTFELSGRFVGNARDLQVLAEAMTTFGFKMNLTTKEGQNQFITFGNILKLVTQGQNFEIQAFQELRALMMGQNFQGAMLARRLEAMGVNVKQMIPLWAEQGTLVENIVSVLGGYEKASSNIAQTMEAQKRTTESMIQLTLAIGLKELYADIVTLLTDINKALMGDKGGAKAMGETIRDTYRALKEELKEIPSMLMNVAGALKFYRDMFNTTKKQDDSKSPILDSMRWLTFKLSELAGYKGTLEEFNNMVKGIKPTAELEYSGPLGGYPAETVSGITRPPSEEDVNKTKKAMREIADFEMDVIIRREKNTNEFEGRKIEAAWKNYKEYLKIMDMLQNSLESRTLIDANELFKMKPDERGPALQARYEELAAKARKAQLEKDSEDQVKIEQDRVDKIYKLNERAAEAIEKLREKMRKVPRDIEEGFRKLADKYKPDEIGISSWTEGENRAIRAWAATMEEEVVKAFGATGEQTTQLKVKIIALRAELELMAGKKGEEKSAFATEALKEQIKDWRHEAETPVMWPWNEEQVKVLKGITDAHEDYEKKLKSFRKEAEKEGVDKKTLDDGEKALYARYANAVKNIREQNDTVMKVTADLWKGWFDSMGNAFASFFEDALTGKLKSFRDYFQSFVNSIISIWSKGIAEMLVKSLQMNMGGGQKMGIGQILSFLSSLIGMGSGSSYSGTPMQSAQNPSAGYMPYEQSGMTYYSWGGSNADGGILRGGFIPVKAFASGGIADRPTLGLIGEGGGPEAVIPLKGGAVPVSLQGGTQKSVDVNFNIVAADTKDFDRLIMDRRSLIAGIIRSELANAGYMRDSMRRYA